MEEHAVTTNDPIAKVTEQLAKYADINYASAVLQWDQEVYMPEKGADRRAQQLATLAGLAHQAGSLAELGKWLEESISISAGNEKAERNFREALRNYTDRRKYTTDFVMEMSKSVSEAFQAWQQARKENRFSLFEPKLEKLVQLKLRECEMLGYPEHPYDALIHLHEPGMTTNQLKDIFNQVKSELVPFIREITSRPQVEDRFTKLEYDKQAQWEFGIKVLGAMGYDFTAGRQDISSHPFTTNFNSRDVRVTTRINDHDLCEMIWSCIHEGGHALYEQGLPDSDYGMPSGEFLSLGIHESQSRLWENNIGRSKSFWKHFYPKLQSVFPKQLGTVGLDEFYRVIKKVQPSLIRTNADELTYHLHVLIRFELEVALIEGVLTIKDLPSAWNEKYKSYLGLDVPTDANGVLQDVHWSHGSFGYFPTYSIGSFYAAQFFHKMEQDLPQLEQQIAEGNMSPALSWLREHIHRHGRLYTSPELSMRITGKKLDFGDFMAYARKKFGNL